MNAKPWLRPPAACFASIFDAAPGPAVPVLAMPLGLVTARDPVRCARTEAEWLAAVEKNFEVLDVEMSRLAAAEPREPLEPLTDEGIAETMADRARDRAERERDDRRAGREAAARVLRQGGPR